MNVGTHKAISPRLVGEPIGVAPGRAVCRLTTIQEMAADARGLVHGGFVFGLADYAAMVAVGDPNVVLGAADVRFLAPCRVGDVITATAVAAGEGKKQSAEVVVHIESQNDSELATEIFRGTFTCFVLPHHVFDRSKENPEKEQP